MSTVASGLLAVCACIALTAIPPTTRAVSYYRAAAALAVMGLWMLAIR